MSTELIFGLLGLFAGGLGIALASAALKRLVEVEERLADHWRQIDKAHTAIREQSDRLVELAAKLGYKRKSLPYTAFWSNEK